jgi:hypothetical protein
MFTSRKIQILFSTISILTIFGVQPNANSLTLNGIEDNGPLDLNPKIGVIDAALTVTVDRVNSGVEVDVKGLGRVSNNGAKLFIFGKINNPVTNNSDTNFLLSSSYSYSLGVDTPVPGTIYAKINADLVDLKPIGIPTSTGVDITSTTFATSFSPVSVSVSDKVTAGTPIVAGILQALKGEQGKLLGPSGLLTVDTEGVLRRNQALIFQSTFEGGFQVPEPSSVFSLLALGTLGAASTLKHKLKPSQSSEKETTKVG